jgi:hypothetical protein
VRHALTGLTSSRKSTSSCILKVADHAIVRKLGYVALGETDATGVKPNDAPSATYGFVDVAGGIRRERLPERVAHDERRAIALD